MGRVGWQVIPFKKTEKCFYKGFMVFDYIFYCFYKGFMVYYYFLIVFIKVVWGSFWSFMFFNGGF